MAKNKNGNKLWIAGAVLGAVAGAAYALWKTPMSGEELRGKLASGPVAQRDDVTSEKAHTPGAADKLLTKVEQTLAPIVGVELGRTANSNGSADHSTTEPIAPVKPAPEPKTPDAPFGAAEVDQKTVPADVAPTGDEVAYGSDTIRAKRFAWGSPTPEAGVQPVPVNPAAEQIIPDAEKASVPKSNEEKESVAADSTSDDGAPTIRSSRFTWGEPAPNTSTSGTATAAPQQRAESVTTPTQETRPVQAVSNSADASKSKQRKFPSLGGLE